MQRWDSAAAALPPYLCTAYVPFLSKLALSRSKTDDQQKCHACYHIGLQVMQIILEQLFWSLAALTMLFFESKRGRGLHWQHEFTARGAGLWLLSTRQ